MESSADKTDFIECQERFKAIFSLTSAATKIIDHNLVIIEVNDALVNLLGYSQEEICGAKILDFACDEYKATWHDMQEAMWKHGKPFFKIDACLRKKDGTLVWVHVTTIMFSQSGTKYAYSVLDDYSYLKEFQESQKRLDMSLEYAGMAVWEIDLENGKVIHSNGFPEILGIEAITDRVSKSAIIQSFVASDAKALEAKLSLLPNSDKGLDFIGALEPKEGKTRWISLKGKTDIQPTGKKIMLGTAQDVTAEKLSERYKDDFISIASHELKTPITVLSGTLQLLQRMNAADPKLVALINQANKSMLKVTSLVGDLLNASRMSEGQLHLNFKSFSIADVLDECCANLNGEGKYELILECDPNLKIFADSERIQQVIVNFISNAIKYAPDERQIIIRVIDEDRYVKISVIDSGPGIDQKKVKYLFQRYYRVDSQGSQYSGLGLGLYISSEIIKKHGGEIGVDTVLGKGSEFWVKIPKVDP